MKTSLLTGILALFCLLSASGMHAQTAAASSTADTTVVTFRFLPGQDMFYTPWAGNGEQLERLYALLDEYRSEITAGRMPVYVDGYCASMPTDKENQKVAFVRSSRVKSELITQKALSEKDFITANYARAYHNNKDMVVVTLRIPAKDQPANVRTERERQAQAERERTEREQTDRERLAAEQAAAQRQAAERAERESAAAERTARKQSEADATQRHTQAAVPSKPYCLAVRTNLLYDAFLLPALGIE